MTSTSILSATIVPLAGFIGGGSGIMLAQVSSNTTLAAQILGPLGLLAGCIAAIKYLVKEKEKIDERLAAQLADHLAHLSESNKTLTTICVQNQTVIEQNSRVLAQVKDHLKKEN